MGYWVRSLGIYKKKVAAGRKRKTWNNFWQTGNRGADRRTVRKINHLSPTKVETYLRASDKRCPGRRNIPDTRMSFEELWAKLGRHGSDKRFCSPWYGNRNRSSAQSRFTFGLGEEKQVNIPKVSYFSPHIHNICFHLKCVIQLPFLVEWFGLLREWRLEALTSWYRTFKNDPNKTFLSSAPDVRCACAALLTCPDPWETFERFS